MAQSQAQETTQVVAGLQAEINRLKHELQTMQVADQIPSAGETCTVADYLLARLVQLKVTVRASATRTFPMVTNGPSEHLRRTR